jgi:hypothetical protein
MARVTSHHKEREKEIKMARRVILSDDFTGEEAEDVSTITYSFENKYYEIDLSEKSATAFEKLLAKHVAVSREITPAVAIGRFKESADSTLTAMREWARANGFEVGDRGRISDEIRVKYEQAVSDLMKSQGNSPTGNVTTSNEAGNASAPTNA